MLHLHVLELQLYTMFWMWDLSWIYSKLFITTGCCTREEEIIKYETHIHSRQLFNVFWQLFWNNKINSGENSIVLYSNWSLASFYFSPVQSTQLLPENTLSTMLIIVNLKKERLGFPTGMFWLANYSVKPVETLSKEESITLGYMPHSCQL